MRHFRVDEWKSVRGQEIDKELTTIRIELSIGMETRRRRKVIGETDKSRIVAAFLDPMKDYVEVAESLGISRSTAWSIVRRYHQDGSVVVRRRGGQRPRLIDEEMVACVIRMVEEFPAYTLQQLNAELRRSLPNKPQVSIATLHRMLDAQFITLKKVENIPAERNSDRVKDARKEHAQWLFENGEGRELIYVDETGHNLWISRTRARAPRGQRAVRVVGGRTGPNLTLTIAVSNIRGLLFSSTKEGGANIASFNQFLHDASEAAGPQHATFIFDNAPCHRRAHESEILEQHNILHLPPYSPFLNIAENAFSVWKAAVKRQLEEVRDQMLLQTHPERLATVAQISEQNLDVITEAHCRASWTKLRSLIPKCLTLQDILQDHA